MNIIPLNTSTWHHMLPMTVEANQQEDITSPPGLVPSKSMHISISARQHSWRCDQKVCTPSLSAQTLITQNNFPPSRMHEYSYSQRIVFQSIREKLSMCMLHEVGVVTLSSVVFFYLIYLWCHYPGRWAPSSPEASQTWHARLVHQLCLCVDIQGKRKRRSTHKGLYRWHHLPNGVASIPLYFGEPLTQSYKGSLVWCGIYMTCLWQNRWRAPTTPQWGVSLIGEA